MDYLLHNKQGNKSTKKVALDDAVFGVHVNEHLIRQAIYVYLQNQRQGTANTKTRAEVRGGGAKPWAQKGTGRARHGSIRSPIWKGGGITFGPRSERNYKKTMPKKMRKSAIRQAFSLLVKDKRLIISEGIEFNKDHLTKQLVEYTEKVSAKKKVLYIHSGDDKNLYLASRNLQNVIVIPVNQINTYTLLNYDTVVIFENVLDQISQMWGSEQGESKKPNKPEAHKAEKLEAKSSQRSASSEKRKVSGKGLGELKLSKRTVTALENNKITTISKLESIAKDEKKLEELEGIGPKSLDEIKKAIK